MRAEADSPPIGNAASSRLVPETALLRRPLGRRALVLTAALLVFTGHNTVLALAGGGVVSHAVVGAPPGTLVADTEVTADL